MPEVLAAVLQLYSERTGSEEMLLIRGEKRFGEINDLPTVSSETPLPKASLFVLSI